MSVTATETTPTVTMRGYALHASNPFFEKVEAKDGERNLDFYYRTLDVRTIDMIGAHDNSFTMVVDDEALLIDKPQPNYLAEGILLALNGEHRPIFGNVLLVGGVDEEGGTLPLSRTEFLAIRSRLERFLAAIS